MTKPSYSPPLTQKRAQAELPGLLSEDLQLKLNQIRDQALRQDIQDSFELMNHYAADMVPLLERLDQMGIAPGQVQYMALTFCLARDHVPGFQTAKKKGARPMKDADAAQLVCDIAGTIKKDRCSVYAAACKLDGLDPADVASGDSRSYKAWVYLRDKSKHHPMITLWLRMFEAGDLSASALAQCTSDMSKGQIPDHDLLMADIEQQLQRKE